MDWSAVPSLVRNYIVPDYNFFSFFPWGAYLAFGMSAGSVIRIIPTEATERAMRWAALAGGGLILVCQYRGQPAVLDLPEVGVLAEQPGASADQAGCDVAAAGGRVFVDALRCRGGWSWVRQFGTTSLLVYWVHIELVYGRWLWFFKNGLNVPETLVTALSIIMLMVAISTLKTYRERVAMALAELGWWFTPKPERVPGD